ncbi:diguanylate cyclase domain-containing protein [Aeromonas veronii]|uniref:diguanylate cyclase domain-containing protein n=1 Tax=Aeromonas veronii TaxID=654 RepID=UPI003D1E2F18
MTENPAPRQPLSWFLPMLVSMVIATLTSPSVRAGEQVIVQLPWQHQFQFAGYYAAIAKGFYREAGLHVTLREADSRTDVVSEVISGKAQFGISGSDLLLDRAAGRPVVVLAALLQHSPLVLLTLDRPDIRNPADLANKRLMLEPGSNELLTYLSHHTRSRDWVTLPYKQGIQALLAGKVDAISAYSTTEPFYLQQKGIPYRVFSPRTIDFDFYGDNLFTSERELITRQDRVYAFQQASLKGWRYAMDHPDEMINLIMEQYPTGAGREQLEFEARETRELMQPDLIEPGYMQQERWLQIAKTYLEAGMLTVLPNLDRFIYDPAQERLRQQRQLLDKSVAVAMLITFTLMTLLGIFLHLYLRLRQEARDRQRLTRELAQSEQHYRFVAENSADVIWTMDAASLRFRYVSPAITPLSGYEAPELFALPLKQLLPDASRQLLREEISATLEAWQRGEHDQTRRVIRTQLRHKDGHLVATETITTLHGNHNAQPEAILGVTRDITERAAREEMMRRLAFYDPLTGLPNRRLLQQRLKELMEQETPRPLALMFIDLDHFKPINDTFGHETGDILLNMVAERMSHCVRKQDLVARLGGDEFVILLPESGDEVLAVADKLHQQLRHPFQLEGQELLISSSIGLALYPEHGEDAKTLMHHADQAMYQAKNRGRGRVCLYTEGLDPEQGALLWQPGHECGHPRIDAEHRQLFVLTNRLLEQMKDQHEDPAPFLESLESLFDMARHHFAFEEQMLAEIDYRELVSHRQDHQRLLNKAGQLLHAAKAGTLGNDELLNFIIQELVVGHMSQADRRYFPLFRSERSLSVAEVVA